ncbi:MAG: hypothetical protein AAF497_18905, partial [Planctomycetota bacterium]
LGLEPRMTEPESVVLPITPFPITPTSLATYEAIGSQGWQSELTETPQQIKSSIKSTNLPVLGQAALGKLNRLYLS